MVNHISKHLKLLTMNDIIGICVTRMILNMSSHGQRPLVEKFSVNSFDLPRINLMEITINMMSYIIRRFSRYFHSGY